MRSLGIVRVRGDELEAREDLVTEEISLRLLAGHRRLAVLMCSPGDLEDLVRGFFYTNGFIDGAEQIRRIVINRATWSAFVELAPEIDPEKLSLPGVVGSACGSFLPLEEAGVGRQEVIPESRDSRRGPRRGSESDSEAPGFPAGSGGDIRMSGRRISELMGQLRDRSQLHRQTGGVHAAALADRTGMLIFREDIGRHNAVDKVIGAHLGAGGRFSDKALLSSGRLSSELLHKAVRCGLPMVVSRSAPTDRAVALARERDITLIGFARGQRMNVYSAAHRLAAGPYDAEPRRGSSGCL
jgi:FdhD protein